MTVAPEKLERAEEATPEQEDQDDLRVDSNAIASSKQQNY